MKLSMWMIANRLSNFTMDVCIRPDAPAVLRSARRAYSTNCVHVYQDPEGVVCDGEGNYIRLRAVSLAEGFEIIQGIFDFYEDWAEQMDHAIRTREYQRVADLAYQVLRNPLILMDGNNRALGITRQYPDDALDEEWAYLCRYGYTSMRAAQQLQTASRQNIYWRHGIQHFSPGKGYALQYGGVSYGMFCHEASCGRLTLLEHDHPLNPGDTQLVEYICARLEPILGHTPAREMMRNINVFHQLLFQQPFEQSDLDYQLLYHNWRRDDVFSLAMLELPPEDSNASLRNSDMLMHVIHGQGLGVVVLRQQNQLFLLANRYLAMDSAVRAFLQGLLVGNPIHVSFSLPCRGIEQAHLLHHQAMYAMTSGKADHPDQPIYDCFDYGVDYMLEAPTLEQSFHACMPAVGRLWEQQRMGGDQFLTLKVFLENERSVSKTAEALFTHRNTVIYRLRKIQEFLKADLDDPYIRAYCRLSIQVLELYQRRAPQTAPPPLL